VGLLATSAVATALLIWRASRQGWCEQWSRVGAVGAAYVAASTLFFWQLWLLPDVSVPRGGGDLVSFLYPTYRFAADELAAGRFPFWNPHLFGGAPFAADLQSGLFYPPNLIAFLAARPFTYQSLETLAALHYPLAGLAAYALARELHLTVLSAFASGLVFAFGGFMVAHLGHYNMLAAAAWAPFVVALLLRAIETGRLAWSLIGGGAFSLVLLAGHTQIALYLALTLVVVWLAAVACRSSAAVAVLLPVMALVGVSASAVLLVPAYELTRLSIRADITYAQAAAFAATPVGMLTFVVPGFFGDAPNDYWGLPGSLQESYGYVGVTGLVLAALALALPSRRRLPSALALFGLFWLLVALGETTPLHGWLYRFVPGFDKVRAPGRGLLFVDMALALFAGLGVGRLTCRPTWRTRPPAAWLLRGLALVVAAGALFVAPLFYAAALTSQDKDPVILQRMLTAAGAVDLSFVFLAVVGLIVWRWRRRWRPWLAPGVVALLALDLAVANGRFNPTLDDLLVGYRHDALIDFLRANVGDGRIDTRTGIADVLQPDVALLAGLDDVSGLFNPLMLRSFNSYWEALGSRSVPGYDLLAVRYVVARPDVPLDQTRFRRVFGGDDGLAAFENVAALPRAFVAPNADRLDELAATARLRDPSFDARQTVLLEPGAPAAPSGTGLARYSRPGPGDISVSLSGVTGGYLVVSEVAYPGWHAALDGREVPILRADNLLMAIPLVPGAQEARLSFRPRGWDLALVLTALGWAAVAAGVILALRRPGPATLAADDLPWT
jgi:hypothetical protein